MEFNNKLKPVVAPQNRGKFKGKPFWIGVVNNLDGKIEDVYDYETAEAADFHHSNYMNPELTDRMLIGSEPKENIFYDFIDQDSPKNIFWFNDSGDIEVGWRNQVDYRYGWMNDWENLDRNEADIKKYKNLYGNKYKDKIYKVKDYQKRNQNPNTLRLIELIKRQLDK